MVSRFYWSCSLTAVRVSCPIGTAYRTPRRGYGGGLVVYEMSGGVQGGTDAIARRHDDVQLLPSPVVVVVDVAAVVERVMNHYVVGDDGIYPVRDDGDGCHGVHLDDVKHDDGFCY